ncbi:MULTISPECIES: hypothetical protein [Nitratireductor]|nr:MULTISPECIES: hypothetical protein [Nitratireductor]
MIQTLREDVKCVLFLADDLRIVKKEALHWVIDDVISDLLNAFS